MTPEESARSATAQGTTRRVARNTAWQGIGELLSRGATLLFYVAMARTLGPRGFGDFTFALALVLFVTLAGFGTDFAIMREVARDRERVHRLFWNANVIKLAFGALGVLLAITFGFVGGYSGKVQATIGVLAVAALVDILARTVQAVFRGLEDMAPIAISLIIQRVFLAVAGTTALALGAGLFGAAVIYLIAGLVGLGYISVRLVVAGIRPELELSLLAVRRLLWDSLPLAFGIVFVTILARLDTIILSALKGDTAVGVYGAAYRIFEAATLAAFVFGNSLYPVLSRLRQDTTPSIGAAFETGVKAMTMVLAPAAAACVLFAHPIVVTAFGPRLVSAADVMRLLGPSVWLWGVALLSMLTLAAQDRHRTVAFAMAFGVVMNAGLNFVLVPAWSYQGAAMAMTGSMIVLALLLIVIAVRHTHYGVSVCRVGAAAAAGIGAMCLLVAALGASVLAALVVIPSSIAVTLAADRFLYPEDLQHIVGAIRPPKPAAESR